MIPVWCAVSDGTIVCPGTSTGALCVGQPALGNREETVGESGADMATVTELGQAGLQGWREKVANGISQPVADRAPLKEDQVRAVVGAAFFVLSVIYVVKTISAATRQARRG
jgi:hypothetical protein